VQPGKKNAYALGEPRVVYILVPGGEVWKRVASDVYIGKHEVVHG
jgi:hypothetical protein